MLSDEQIDKLYKPGKPYSTAKAIEAEVRKQDTELIRQMLEALENHDGNYKLSKSAGAAVNAAITAARARLEPKP
jgi:predicted ArsR family transcriptional regulator